MDHPIEIVLRLVAIVAGCALTLRAARRPTRRGRAFWRALGTASALVPCLVTYGETRGFGGTNEVTLFAGAIAIGLVVGAFAIARGLRGRRVGDHPYCRRCGFDLFGRPPATRVCGECGASLDAPRAIVVGERRRRPQSLAFGGFVLAVSLGYLASSGRDVYRWATTTDFSSYKPASWLIDDVWNRNRIAADRAGIEINRRIEAGTFGRTNTRAFVTRLLDAPYPAPTRPGVHVNVTHAMYVVEAAFAHGEVDDATARRAMRAVLDCTLVVAPQASRGRTLRYWIAAGDYRFAREKWALSTLSIANRIDLLDGRPLPAPTWSTLRGSGEWPGSTLIGNAFDLAGVDAPLGPATLTTRFTLALTLAAPGRPTLVESRDVALTGTTTLVDAKAMTCPPVVAAPTVDGPQPTTVPVVPRPTLRIYWSREVPQHRTLTIYGASGGALLADVVLTTALGAERALGTIFVEPNGSAELPFDDRPAGPYTIELRPVPARGADLFRVVPTFALPTTVPSSAIVDMTSP